MISERKVLFLLTFKDHAHLDIEFLVRSIHSPGLSSRPDESAWWYVDEIKFWPGELRRYLFDELPVTFKLGDTKIAWAVFQILSGEQLKAQGGDQAFERIGEVTAREEHWHDAGLGPMDQVKAQLRTGVCDILRHKALVLGGKVLVIENWKESGDAAWTCDSKGGVYK